MTTEADAPAWSELPGFGYQYDGFSADDYADLLGRRHSFDGNVAPRPDQAIRCERENCRSPVVAVRGAVLSWLSPFGPAGTLEEESTMETLRQFGQGLSYQAHEAKVREHLRYITWEQFHSGHVQLGAQLQYGLFATGRLAWSPEMVPEPLIALCRKCDRYAAVVSHGHLRHLLRTDGVI